LHIAGNSTQEKQSGIALWIPFSKMYLWRCQWSMCAHLHWVFLENCIIPNML